VAALYLRNRENFEIQAHDLKVEMLRDIQETWEVEAFYDDSPFNVAAARDLGVNAVYVPGNESYWRSKGQLPA
jgi:FMN phosphatase YigB (HAD superfamily)